MSRLIDSRGRLFGKVNVVDILVLAVVVALAVFVGLRLSGSDAAASTETKPVTVTFLLQPAHERMIDSYTVLGDVKDDQGRFIGTIAKTEVAERNQVAVSGRDWAFTLDFAAPPAVIVDVAAEGRISGDSVHVGPLAARAGAIVQLVGPGWEGEARILRVEESTAAAE